VAGIVADLNSILAVVLERLAEWRTLRLSSLHFLHRDDARLVLIVLAGMSVAMLAARLAWRTAPERHRIGLPSLLPSMGGSPMSAVRHGALLLFLVGAGFFAFALADPFTSLSRQTVSYPGRRISLLLDASSSMMAPFTADTLNAKGQADIAFSTSVSALEYFMRLRIAGKYRDLMALIEFGDEAYVITPFTSDYENILLSASLVGDLREWGAFPDKGTIIAQAIEQSVALFRTFEFLDASGNVMVIFSDGQDTQVSAHGRSVYDILDDAVRAEVPVYFIRTAYNRQLNGLIPDEIWKPAVERTGGRFYAASNEATIVAAMHDIDRLSAGRIEVQHYVVRDSHFAPYATIAVVLWTMALGLGLLVPYFRRFP
jgi:Ca-activated chloride channel homolog